MKNKDQGFTLVEIIVAIAILGVLTGIVGIGISGYRDFADKQHLKSETQRLYYSILKARNDTILERNNRNIRIIRNTNKVFVTNVTLGKTSMIELSKGVIIEHTTYLGNTVLRIYGTGIMTPGGRIILKSPRDKYMTIVIQPISGRVYIEEGWKS